MAERCKVINLDITGDQLGRAVQDPALAALVADGWVVGANLVTNQYDDQGNVTGQVLSLVMMPPPEATHAVVQVEATPDPRRWWDNPIATLWVATAVFCVMLGLAQAGLL